MEAACNGTFACPVGSTETDEEEEPLKTIDFSRLSAILWTVCRDLNNKLIALDTANTFV